MGCINLQIPRTNNSILNIYIVRSTQRFFDPLFCYLPFFFLRPNEITNVGSVLNPSRRCSSNVMLGKSFEDFFDRFLSLNCRSSSARTCPSVFPEGKIVSFGNVIFNSFRYLTLSFFAGLHSTQLIQD